LFDLLPQTDPFSTAISTLNQRTVRVQVTTESSYFHIALYNNSFNSLEFQPSYEFHIILHAEQFIRVAY